MLPEKGIVVFPEFPVQTVADRIHVSLHLTVVNLGKIGVGQLKEPRIIARYQSGKLPATAGIALQPDLHRLEIGVFTLLEALFTPWRELESDLIPGFQNQPSPENAKVGIAPAGRFYRHFRGKISRSVDGEAEKGTGSRGHRIGKGEEFQRLSGITGSRPFHPDRQGLKKRQSQRQQQYNFAHPYQKLRLIINSEETVLLFLRALTLLSS